MKPVTFVTFSASGNRIATRSDADECVRVWDVDGIVKESKLLSRKVGSRRGDDGDHHHPQCIAICTGLPALNEASACAFGCDGSIICAGTSVHPKHTNTCGQLKFFQLAEESSKAGRTSKSKNKPERLDPILSVGVAPNASVLGVCWHAKLNQIAIGTSNGM